MRMRVIGALLGGAALSACGLGIAAGADYDPNLDFGRYASFVWDEPDDRPIGDPRLENNPFFEQRLHAAIAVELAAHGIRADGEGRGLIVHHHATVRSRVDVYEADVREGYSGAPRSDAPQMVQFEEGTILIDIADAESRAILWRGWAQFDITRALANPDLMAQAIEEAVSKMFDDFPGG